MSETDRQLLDRYCAEKSEAAFSELVERNIDLVYSAALRQVRSGALAEEVVQAVFLELCQRADRLSSATLLSAWLYQVTRRKAIDVVRSEVRRQRREKVAAEMSHDSQDPSWRSIEPALDEAMESLSASDRTAVLLRYFENKSLREVGEQLGTSEDAAQKRVTRAVDRLREFLGQRKVAVSATSLTALLATNAVHAAPLGMVGVVSAAISGASIGLGAASQAIVMTTLQKTMIAGAFVMSVGVGVYQSQMAHQRKGELETLRQEAAGANVRYQDSLQKLESELAARAGEIERLRHDLAELPKLRGEVARLRQEREKLARVQEPPTRSESAARDLVERVSALKGEFETSPEAWIPELDLVDEEDWIVAASEEISSEVGLRKAMSRIRLTGELRLAGKLSDALKQYGKQHNDEFPQTIADLSDYLGEEVSAEMLDRWQVAASDVVDNVSLGTDWVITQKEAVDEVFDERHVVGPGGRGSTGFLGNLYGDTFFMLNQLYRNDNGGQEPAHPSELMAYARTPEEESVVDRYILRRE